MEDLQVAADGHVRDAQDLDEVGNPYRAILADPLEDQRLSLPREHLGDTSLRDRSIPASRLLRRRVCRC